MDAKQLAGELALNTEAVCRHLLPGGQSKAGEWCVGSVYGEAGNSLKVRLAGNKAGVWSDFQTGESGDLIDLWQAVTCKPFTEALAEVKDYLGISARFNPAVPLSSSPVKAKKKEYTAPEKPQCSKPNGIILEYLTRDRALTQETIEAYKLGQQGRSVVFQFLQDGELKLWKSVSLDRENGKKQIRGSLNPPPSLFGWHLIPDTARQVVITEGEIDAMTVHQWGYSALSVPNGAGNKGWIEYEWERLERFSDIIICFDEDDAGRKAVPEIVSRLGRHRCRVIALTHKDANECLKNGLTKEEFTILVNAAESMDPAELRPASDYLEDVLRYFYPHPDDNTGKYFPWDKTRDTLRVRPSEVSIWTGINGHGKSQMLGYVILNLINQGEKACIASLEMKPRISLGRLYRQASSMLKPSHEYVRTIDAWAVNSLWIFDFIGTTTQEKLLETFKYAYQRYGVTQFVIDSLMKCGIRDDDYSGQKAFMDKLCEFKNEFDACHVHLVAHNRKGESESAQPGKMDIKGTGSLADLADNVYSVWRNKKRKK